MFTFAKVNGKKWSQHSQNRSTTPGHIVRGKYFRQKKYYFILFSFRERDICEINRHVFLLLLVKVDGIIPRDLTTDKIKLYFVNTGGFLQKYSDLGHGELSFEGYPLFYFLRNVRLRFGTRLFRRVARTCRFRKRMSNEKTKGHSSSRINKKETYKGAQVQNFAPYDTNRIKLFKLQHKSLNSESSFVNNFRHNGEICLFVTRTIHGSSGFDSIITSRVWL